MIFKNNILQLYIMTSLESGEIQFSDIENILWQMQCELRTKEGISGILVEAVRDPDSLGRSVAGSGKSSGNGKITLAINEFGVGWMKEVWDLRVMMGGDLFAQNRVEMPKPGSNLRLLVVVSPGTEVQRSSMEEEQQRQLEDSGIHIPESSIFRR